VILFALIAVFAAVPAFALNLQEKLLGSFGAWQPYTSDEGGQMVCYMVTTKTNKTTGPKKRAAPYLMITHRPIEASTDVVSYGAGVALDAKRGVKIQVGSKAFDLFSVRDTAWARDSLTDHKLASALRNATTAQASALSDQKGTSHISDQFDLAGMAAAYHSIGEACGLPDATSKKAAAAKLLPKKVVVKKAVMKNHVVKNVAAKKIVAKKTAVKTTVLKKHVVKKALHKKLIAKKKSVVKKPVRKKQVPKIPVPVKPEAQANTAHKSEDQSQIVQKPAVPASEATAASAQ
jgi:hypothetical protein